MKQQLSSYAELQLLKRNSKLQSEVLYMITSESTAQSIYFETKRDIMYAHRQIKKHLLGIVQVIDYLFTPHGWALIIETKSEENILAHCKRSGRLSKTIRSAIRSRNISVIISEYIRYTISSIASYINCRSKRKGTVVRENFSRYIFGSLGEVRAVIMAMKKNEINLCRQRQRYRPKLRFWDEAGELLGVDNIYLTTRRMTEKGRKNYRVDFQGIVVDVRGGKTHVLRKLLNNGIKSHHPQLSLPPNQISRKNHTLPPSIP